MTKITILTTAAFVFVIAVFLWVMEVPYLAVCWGHGARLQPTDIVTGWRAMFCVWPLTLAVALTSVLIGGGIGRIAAKDGYREAAELRVRSVEGLHARSLENMAAATEQASKNSKEQRLIKQERQAANLEVTRANARAEEAEARAAAAEQAAGERVAELETKLEKMDDEMKKVVGQLLRTKRKAQKIKEVDSEGDDEEP